MVDREPSSVARGRRYVRGLLESKNVDDGGILLVVSELMTNAIDHGDGTRMGLVLAEDDDRIRVEVVDAGAGAPQLREEVNPENERGRGLMLVAAVSEEWGVRSRPDSTTVWAELLRKPH
jgi:anti-sigma regulatory factor (Ser/Thr protein kinase)